MTTDNRAAPGAAVVSRQAFREFASLAAWLENPNESCADRSNPSRIAAAIRGILQAASAVCRCPRCGDVTTEPDAYCAACQKTVTRNIEPAAVSPLALKELDALVGFISEQRERAANSLKTRRDEAASWREGSDDDYREGQKLAEQMTGRAVPYLSRAERFEIAQRADRIAAKYVREVELYDAVLARLRAGRHE